MPFDPVKKRVETVGRIHPHVKAKIIDSEGNVVPVNTPGELCVAGYLVQKGFVIIRSHGSGNLLNVLQILE